MSTQAMQFSNFKGPFASDIDSWALKLQYMAETLDAWLRVQRSWLYLQLIFDSQDIARQLPSETKRFRAVDNTWRNITGLKDTVTERPYHSYF